MADDKYFKGRGSQIQTANPFLQQQYVSEHIEGLDEPLLSQPQTQIFKESPKKIVSKVDSPDLGKVYSVNPYQGCEHGCVYCYARNSHQYWGFSAGLDFESKIIVKEQAARLLEKELRHKSWELRPIMISGNTDCYQPLERKFKLTRQLLQLLKDYRHPVGIITKNSLITRDVDILEEMAKHHLVHVYFSINTLNEELRGKMEPRTASARKKLEAMELLSQKGIPVGVMNAPVIPGLNDHEIPEIIRQSAEHGARAAGYTIVRLNGSLGPLFGDWLRKNYPDRFEKVWNGICSLHAGKVNDSQWGRRMGGEGPLALAISQLFRLAKRKYLSGRSMPAYNLQAFRRGSQYTLF
ncbi:PA0069 family radical SAM protein [Nafulsella turpanensis]|uniref:PA0069 family radical SAM protein n=1 Tax=Nafulsella turpanensis TaxID=1265690 RepID=UPI000346DA30|nr:PA0069 family radical SAM protein [Nafulsella turpanensis]